jgi:hypothetical protein
MRVLRTVEGNLKFFAHRSFKFFSVEVRRPAKADEFTLFFDNARDHCWDFLGDFRWNAQHPVNITVEQISWSNFQTSDLYRAADFHNVRVRMRDGGVSGKEVKTH